MNKFEIFSPGDFGGFTIPHERYEEINSKLICVFACFNINTEILWGIKDYLFFTKEIVFVILLEI